MTYNHFSTSNEVTQLREQLAQLQAQQESAHRQLQLILQFVFQRGDYDQDHFFETLVRSLARAANVESVFVGELILGSHNRVCTVAFYDLGHIQPNIEYELNNTPCENVIGKQLRCYPAHVQQLFPRDTLLADMQAESYVGMPLWDSKGNPLGIIVVLDRKPLTNPAFVETLLQVVAQRAAHELEQQRIEHKLRESETRFQSLAEHLPDCVYVYDFAERRIVYLNRPGFLGYTIDELTSADSVTANLHPDDSANVLAHWQDLYQKTHLENCSIEYRLRSKNGQWEWLRQRETVISVDAQGRPTQVLVSLTVETPRKNAEKELQLSRERLEALYKLNQQRGLPESDLLSLALDAMVNLSRSEAGCWHIYDSQQRTLQLAAWSTASDTTAHRTNWMNPCPLEQAGVWAECVQMGKPVIHNIVHNDEQTPVRKQGNLAHPVDHVQFVRRVSLPVYDEGQIVAVVGVGNKADPYDQIDVDQLSLLAHSVWEIVKHKRSDEWLRKLSRAVEQSPMSIVVTDVQAKIEYVNPKFTELSGYTLQEALGQNPRLLQSSLTPPETYAALWATLQAGHTWQGEFVNKKKNGELYWEAATIAPVKDDRGRITHYIGIKEDITQRKRAEEALQKSQQLIKATFASLPAAIFIISPGRKIVDCNEAATEMFGYSRDELLNRETLFLHKDAAAFAAFREHIMAAGGQLKHFEFELKRKDGTIFATEHAVLPIQYGTGELGTISVIHDITERKQAENALRESEQYIRQLIEESPLAIIVSGEADERHLLLNRKFTELFGYTIEDMPTIHEWWELAYPDEAYREYRKQVWKSRIQSAIKNHNTIEPTETVVRCKDGSNRYIQFHFSSIGDRNLNVLVDLTERKQAERALRESEERYRSVVTALAEGVILLTANGVIQAANKAAKNILELNHEQMNALNVEIDQPSQVWRYVREDGSQLPSSEDPSMLALQTGHTYSNVVLGFYRTDGSLIWLELNATPLFHEGEPKPYAAVISFTDITQRRNAEAELKRHQDHLEELVEQRTAELRTVNQQLLALSRVKDEFVSNVSHELRTPITSLKLQQYLLEKQPEQLSKRLAAMKRETERLSRLIEDLLQLSRLDQGRADLKLTRVNLNDLVEAYVYDRTPVAEQKGLALELVPDLKLPLVVGDPNLLGQVFGILLTNAINYTPSGGRISIKTHLQESDSRQMAAFSIRDTGLGIAPHEQEQLFERFFRGTAGQASSAPGTGLGLAIAKEIVDRHAGTIEVESAGVPGHGSTFTVWLPAASRTNSQSAAD